MILCITCYSCDDPYKDTVFKVYDVQPAATYLQNRPDAFMKRRESLLSKIWDMNMPALLLHIMSSMTPLIGRIL